VRVADAPLTDPVRRVLVTIVVAAMAFGCGAESGARSGPPADLDEVLLSPTKAKRLTAMNVRTCVTRELPIGSGESVAFTRDHKTVATLREIQRTHSGVEPSRLRVGPASQDERDTVWTVGDFAAGGMAFDPSGQRLALGLQTDMDRGGNVAAGAVGTGLWIVNNAGDGRRQLGVVTGSQRRFAWSPDGTQIAGSTFESSPDHSGSPSKVWIVDVESGRQRIVTTLDQPTGANGVMDWSPDGQNILLFTGRADNGLYGPSKLEQIAVADGRRATLLDPATDDIYMRAVYAADGKSVIVKRLHVVPRPAPPPPPPGEPMVTPPDPRKADLVSVSTSGPDVHSLCPIDPDSTLLDWH